MAIQIGTAYRQQLARRMMERLWGRIWVYTEPVPATPFVTATGTLLATIILPDSEDLFWGGYNSEEDASEGYIGSFGWPLEVNASNTGVAAYYRIGLKGGSTSAFASSGTNVVEQGLVSTDETADMVLLDTQLTQGEPFILADARRLIPLVAPT